MENSTAGITPSVLKELQADFGVKASKALGQNFLIDPNMCNKIAQMLPENTNVIEIGPGVGSLTVQLARRAKKVFAIELDKHMLAPLGAMLERYEVAENVETINDDVMKVDLQQLCLENEVEYIFGNLPYNISAPLLADISLLAPKVKCVVAMVQKEVGERLSAKQGTRQVGAITYKTQYFMDIENLFQVPKMSFIPRPHVDSVVIKMERRASHDQVLDGPEVKKMFKLIETAFSQRRKMLRQSLKLLLGEQLDTIFVAANVDPTRRPEQLENNEFMELNRAWIDQGKRA